jgi:DNA-binding MarR family transcriptional regulator
MTTSTLPPDPIGRIIYFTAQEIHNQAKKLLQPFDITLEQYHTLKVLTLHDGQTQCHLCRETNKTAANMTRLLDRLEKKALLVRRENPDDRRASCVMVTDKGRSLVKELRSHLDAFSATLTGSLSENDQQALRTTLQTINTNLKAMSGKRRQAPPLRSPGRIVRATAGVGPADSEKQQDK